MCPHLSAVNRAALFSLCDMRALMLFTAFAKILILSEVSFLTEDALQLFRTKLICKLDAQKLLPGHFTTLQNITTSQPAYYATLYTCATYFPCNYL